jgi:hypothetical protein
MQQPAPSAADADNLSYQACPYLPLKGPKREVRSRSEQAEGMETQHDRTAEAVRSVTFRFQSREKALAILDQGWSPRRRHPNPINRIGREHAWRHPIGRRPGNHVVQVGSGRR